MNTREMAHRMAQHAEAVAQRRQAAARVKKTRINIECDGCKAVVLTVKATDFKTMPNTTMLAGRQALEKHIRETGCIGVAITEEDAKALLELAGPEVDELAQALGIERLEAAKMAAGALRGMEPEERQAAVRALVEAEKAKKEGDHAEA